MSGSDDIADDEYLLRHVPSGTRWQAPGPRITSGNFELRPNETGVSVTRLQLTSAARLLERLGEDGSRIAAARAADVRALGFRVLPKPINEDAGHAEIQSDQARLDDHADRKRLAKAFQFLPEESARS